MPRLGIVSSFNAPEAVVRSLVLFNLAMMALSGLFYLFLRKVVLFPLAAVEPAARTALGKVVAAFAALLWLAFFGALASIYASAAVEYSSINGLNRLIYGICGAIWVGVLGDGLDQAGRRELETLFSKGAWDFRDHMAYLVWFDVFRIARNAFSMLAYVVFCVWPGLMNLLYGWIVVAVHSVLAA